MPIHPGDEERIATTMSRDLQDLAAESAIRPPVGFVDRVMAAVAVEPLPQPARAFGVALLGGRFRAAAASLGDAVRVVVGGSTPVAVRGQALALVLVVAIGLIAIAGGATVGAIDLLSANHTPAPSPTTPLPSEPQPSPSPSLSPSLTPEPSSTSEATETPEPTEPTDTPEATQRPGGGGLQPTPTDDHGGGGDDGEGSGHDGSSTDSGSSSDSGSSGDTHTETPQPTETDEHDGSHG
jgi:hypothetical protein